MPILTTIVGIPLYSTQAEALAWASSRGLSGFHTHEYQGQTGYMGGITHNQAMINNSNIITEQNTLNENNNIITPPFTSTTGGGGGGSSY
jgi:hypothetical protein